MAARFRELYDTRYREELQRELGITNRFAVPRLQKIVLNMGVGVPSQSTIRGGLAKEDDKGVEGALRDLEAIAGQKPVATEARKPIAGFKIRQGMKIGCKVTLRSTRMYEFLDRLINIALPRVRDFRGVDPNSFDGNGNFALGLREQIVFPEIDYDTVDQVRGLDVVIGTTTSNDDWARALLLKFNMPFRGQGA